MLGSVLASTYARSHAGPAARTQAEASGTLRVPSLRVALCTPDSVAGAAGWRHLPDAALPGMPGCDAGHLPSGARPRAGPRARFGARARARRLRADRAPAHVSGAAGP